MIPRALALVAFVLALAAGCVRVVDLSPGPDAGNFADAPEFPDAAFLPDGFEPDAGPGPVPDAAFLPDAAMVDA